MPKTAEGDSMQSVPKYKNIDERFPELVEVLKNSIQSEILEIKHIDRSCEKYKRLCQEFAELNDAEFVVFSKYIKKDDHKHEMFAFVDDKGKIVCHLSGRELELYGMLEGCYDLEMSEEFSCSWHQQ